MSLSTLPPSRVLATGLATLLSGGALLAAAPDLAVASVNGSAQAQAANVAVAATASGPLAPIVTALGLTLAAQTPVQNAPAANGTAASGIGVNAGVAATVAATATGATASATRANASVSAQSGLATAGLSVLGTQVLTTGAVSSSVRCPVVGTPTAAVRAVTVRVGGVAIAVGTGTPAVGTVNVTAAGLTNARVQVSLGETATVTANGATAIGLTAQLRLLGQLPIVGTAVDVPLGAVTLARSQCTRPDASPVTAPTVSGITPNTGSTTGGQTVTITGTGFTGATGVSFGGVPATGVVVHSPTSITAVVPPAAAGGPVGVVVTTPGGVSAPAPYRYTAPSIIAVTPNRGPTAGGTSITITGTGFSPTATVTVGGKPATGVVVNRAGTSITATTPAGPAGPVDVSVVQTGADATARHAFTYVAPATGAAPRITRNPSSATVFIGQRVLLTAAATGRPTPSVQWQSEPRGQHVFRAIRGAVHRTFLTPRAGRLPIRYRAVFTNPFGSATTTPATIRTTMVPAAPPVFFDTAKATLTASDKRTLNTLRRHLTGITSVVCTGYTDSRGDNPYNGALGFARARAACAYLLRGTHITAVLRSEGKTHPFASNRTAHGQALNRRTMFGLQFPRIVRR